MKEILTVKDKIDGKEYSIVRLPDDKDTNIKRILVFDYKEKEMSLAINLCLYDLGDIWDFRFDFNGEEEKYCDTNTFSFADIKDWTQTIDILDMEHDEEYMKQMDEQDIQYQKDLAEGKIKTYDPTEGLKDIFSHFGKIFSPDEAKHTKT
jgi:chloramphenicol O-acetyltransferase